MTKTQKNIELRNNETGELAPAHLIDPSTSTYLWVEGWTPTVAYTLDEDGNWCPELAEECAYCLRDAPAADGVPAVHDDDAWEHAARGHASDCEWVTTRAHQYEGKLYVISSKYVGPGDCSNTHTYWISHDIGRKNLSQEPASEGWLGTTNDYSRHAHGAFDTLSEARSAIMDMLGHLTPDVVVAFGDVIESYRASEYEEWDADSSCAWAHDWIKTQITASTTNEQIGEMVSALSDEAIADADASLDTVAIERMARSMRDNLAEVENV